MLAAAVARDPAVEAAFSAFVLWLPVGQEADLLRLLSRIAGALGEPEEALRTVEEARSYVAARLAEARLLLVIDDVWELSHAAALDVMGALGRLLITTRNAEVLAGMGAVEQRVV